MTQPPITLDPSIGSLIVNGKPWHGILPSPSTLDRWLVAQDFSPRSVVVELNGVAISPSQFSSQQLQIGDRLEIVKIVAGG